MFNDGFEDYTKRVDQDVYDHIRSDEAELSQMDEKQMKEYFATLTAFPEKHAKLVEATILKAGRTPGQVQVLSQTETSAVSLRPLASYGDVDMTGAAETADVQLHISVSRVTSATAFCF